MSNYAPKYSKIELLLYPETKNNPTATINLLSFDDCGLMITGNYIVVIMDERDEVNNNLTSTGKIFDLKTVKAYKTYSK